MGNREKAIAQRLAKCEEAFCAGQAFQALEAMSLCLQFDIPIPTWAVGHFCTSVTKYANADAKTLDEAFGVYRPKSWSQAKAKARIGGGLAVNIRMHYDVEKNGKAVKVAAADAAEKRPMSESAAERWYYDAEINRALGRPQKSRKAEDD